MPASTSRRILGVATALVSVGAAGLVMAAPADAAAIGVAITTPSGFGSSQNVYGAGCQYKVAVTINNARPREDVQFVSRHTSGVVTPMQKAKASGTKASFTWKPTRPGRWTLMARQNDNKDANKQETWVMKKVRVGSGFALPNSSDGTCVVVFP
ncbi:hypothetical protein [Gordonia sp. SL306]|uniref:hypothetical protein n=1 Tax=Gordonia sp. SL306 TaxID=2995145 RepID=UPI0022703C68|nr:hypothetical protein [Gordonia sp. SL306]WAC55735.1 hypothetical protein OVA31_00155 [Gordonia sp. SL306]